MMSEAESATLVPQAQPESLQRQCLKFVCSNLEQICVKTTCPSSSIHDDQSHLDDEADLDLNAALNQLHRRLKAKLNESETKVLERLTFPDEVMIHTELSEELLKLLNDSDKINDVVMTLFEGDKTRLKRVKIDNASRLSRKGLQSLMSHKLVELEMSNLVKATVNDLIQNLNSDSVNQLKVLNVSNSTFVDANKHANVVGISKLKNLSSLNVSGTEFNKNNLDMIMDDLPYLEHLDISNTKVKDISALKKAKSRLKSLTMYDLKLSGNATEQNLYLDTILQLKELIHLDVSYTKDETVFDALVLNSKLKISDLMLNFNALPKLISLDISGRELSDVELLKNFLLHHKNLKFLGLMMTELCSHSMFEKYSEISNQMPDLFVTGNACEEQTLEALKRYSHRPYFVQKALSHLFSITHGCKTEREDVIRMVLTASRRYPSVFQIQMAVTACLYNLTHEVSQKLHPHLLNEIVQSNLDAMEVFPQHHQMQKNCLLTMCSDRIINDVNFDRLRCAKLALNCLNEFQDGAMNRMSVAIISMLAARITTAQTTELGSNLINMQKLLSVVRNKKEDKQIDITLKYTLSALWNLTDESPTTCSVFLGEGGMELFIEVLDTFPGDKCIETKVLGLLNNIAEVAHLRSHFYGQSLKLISYMYSTEIDVGYFAAGIAAHLASDDQLDWSKILISKSQLVEELGNVVTSWKRQVPDLVAYRSFKPFYPLMKESQPLAVKMWAVWAVHHVCCNKGERYGPMLTAQGGDKILLKLLDEKVESPENMKSMIREIFSELENTNGYKVEV